MGSNWSTPHVLDESTYCGTVWPSIAVSDAGHAVAAWRASEVLDTLHDHLAASVYDATSWSPATSISGAPPITSGAQVAMDREGHGMALVAFNVEFNTVMHAVHFAPNTGWDAPLPIGNDTAEGATPKVAFDGSGQALAVWQERAVDNSTRMIARRYRPSEGWTAPELISHPRGRGGDPVLAVNNSGQAVVVWGAVSVSNVRLESIWANLFDPSRGWSEPVIVQEGGVHQGPHWSAAINQTGQAVLVWRPWFDAEPNKTGTYAVVHTPDW
jgi:hypothetical protein